MNRISLIFLLLSLSTGLLAQNSQYEKAMHKSLEAFEAATSAADMQAAANRFERIAKAEKEAWLPAYYAALTYTLMSFDAADGDQKDLLLDRADDWVDHSLAIAPQESELHALQAFICQGRIQVDPMGRGMQYTIAGTTALEKAKALNPDNPRIYYLNGQNTFYMPPFAGGGKEAARPLLEQAKVKFEAFEAPAKFWPSWGKQQNEALLKQCE